MSGIRQTLDEDYFLILPAGTPHVYGPDDRHPWTLHWAAFNGPNAMEYTRQLPQNQNAAPVAPEIRSEILQLFAKLYALLEEGLSTSYLICASKILEHILGLLFFHNPALHGVKAGGPDPATRAIQHMQQRLHQPMELAQLARSVNLSPTHFSRVFKEKTGCSPIEYLIRLKIQRACQHLNTTEHSIRKIAEYVGYEDSAYFSRIFKKVMGTSPEQYRKS